MSGKVTVRNSDNSCDAGTAIPYTGTTAVCLGFESISIRAIATQDTSLSLFTGQTTSSMTAAVVVTATANTPCVITHAVAAQYFYVHVSGGAGTLQLETLLHSGHTETRFVQVSDTTGAVVPTGTDLVHEIDLGASVRSTPISVGLFLNSDDTTASAFALESSYDGGGGSWFLIRKTTTSVQYVFETIDSNGARYLRVKYSNGSGVDKNVTVTSSYWG